MRVLEAPASEEVTPAPQEAMPAAAAADEGTLGKPPAAARKSPPSAFSKKVACRSREVSCERARVRTYARHKPLCEDRFAKCFVVIRFSRVRSRAVPEYVDLSLHSLQAMPSPGSSPQPPKDTCVRDAQSLHI